HRRLYDAGRAVDVQTVVAAPVLVAPTDGELELGGDVPRVLRPQRLRLRLAVALSEHAGARAAVGPARGVVGRVLERVVLVVHTGAQRVGRDLPERLPRPLEVERRPAGAVEHRDATVRVEARAARCDAH